MIGQKLYENYIIQYTCSLIDRNRYTILRENKWSKWRKESDIFKCPDDGVMIRQEISENGKISLKWNNRLSGKI